MEVKKIVSQETMALKSDLGDCGDKSRKAGEMPRSVPDAVLIRVGLICLHLTLFVEDIYRLVEKASESSLVCICMYVFLKSIPNSSYTNAAHKNISRMRLPSVI